MSTAFSRQILRATTTDVVSDVIETVGMDVLWLQVATTVTATTLVGTLTIGGAVALSGAPPTAPALAGTSAVLSSPAVTNAAYADGVITYASGLAVATHQHLIKIVHPPPFVIVTYDYTSGGGAVDIIVRAGGWLTR